MAPGAPAVARVMLIGMMGAGKSTTGRLLAARLGWEYLDSDEEVLRHTGRTVPEIWHAEGEAAFRRQEAAVLVEAASSAEPAVVAVAGGAVLDPVNRQVVRAAGLVVWLRVRVATLTARVGDGVGRPLLDGDPEGALTRLEAERRPAYQSLAEIVIDVDGLAPDAIVGRITVALQARGVVVPPPTVPSPTVPAAPAGGTGVTAEGRE